MGWFLAIAAIALFCWAMKAAMDQQKIRTDNENAFRDSRRGWDLYVSPHDAKVIGLNRDGGQIVLGTAARPVEYDTSRLVSVEIVKDGASISSTNRGSQVAGAALGAALLGPAGLLLGGLSGSKRSRATVHSLALKLIMDDRAQPVHTVEFFRSPNKHGTDAKSKLLIAPVELMDRYNALIVTAIRNQVPHVAPMNSTDELARLWDLKVAGALTTEEFENRKLAVLALIKPDESAVGHRGVQ